MYIVFMLLNRWICIQLRHYCQYLIFWWWKLQLGIYQIPAELIKAGDETLRFEIHNVTAVEGIYSFTDS